MVRGQLPKAYLRMDPDLDAKHPDNLAEFIRIMCAANRQPWRGRFRNRAVLEAIVGKPAAKRAIDRGDLIPAGEHECRHCPPGEATVGTLYLDGWDTWQEGDMTVSERMRGYRDRRNTKRNGAVTSTVTQPSHEPSPPSEASDNKASIPQPPAPYDADDLEVLADGLLGHPATPRQLQAVRGLSHKVGKAHAVDVLRHWLRQPEVDDQFGAALAQLQTEADVKGKRGRSQFAYMDEPAS